MFSLMKFAIAPLVALRSAIASTHLVKYVVATRIHMYRLEDGLTGPTKSSPQVWKGHGVTMLYKLCGWVWIKLASTWQPWHFLTNSTASLLIVGQQQPICNMHQYSFFLPQCSLYSPAYTSLNISLASSSPKRCNRSPSYPFLKRIPSCRK